LNNRLLAIGRHHTRMAITNTLKEGAVVQERCTFGACHDGASAGLAQSCLLTVNASEGHASWLLLLRLWSLPRNRFEQFGGW
jgi:hypothetical protein